MQCDAGVTVYSIILFIFGIIILFLLIFMLVDLNDDNDEYAKRKWTLIYLLSLLGLIYTDIMYYSIASLIFTILSGILLICNIIYMYYQYILYDYFRKRNKFIVYLFTEDGEATENMNNKIEMMFSRIKDFMNKMNYKE
jgi:hypothetical protein